MQRSFDNVIEYSLCYTTAGLHLLFSDVAHSPTTRTFVCSSPRSQCQPNLSTVVYCKCSVVDSSYVVDSTA